MFVKTAFGDSFKNSFEMLPSTSSGFFHEFLQEFPWEFIKKSCRISFRTASGAPLRMTSRISLGFFSKITSEVFSRILLSISLRTLSDLFKNFFKDCFGKSLQIFLQKFHLGYLQGFNFQKFLLKKNYYSQNSLKASPYMLLTILSRVYSVISKGF